MATSLTFAINLNGDTQSESVTISGGGGSQHIEDTVNASTTDRQINCAIDASGLKALFIVSDQDLTLEANNGTTPDFTLTLTADKPLVWISGSGITNPITADVTEFYATNAGGTNASLDIFVEQDPTP